jgi:tetratricopeptide (TPR) repeat protein
MSVKTSFQYKLTRREQRDLEIEIGFLERLVQRDPKYLDALQLLGIDYTQRGSYELSLKIDRRLARLKPGDPTVLYNLACSCSRTRKIKQAARALLKAISCGFDDYSVLMRDPDLANLRRDPEFHKVKERLRYGVGRRKDPTP